MTMSFNKMSASFSDYWSRIRQQIDAELGRRVPKIIATDSGLEMEAIMRAVDGGKRIRSCLVCLICDALGGLTERALSRAIAIECVQAASLIHDDYIDGDNTRRERPACWIIDGGRRAVLVGDVMFATAIEQMAANGAEDGTLIARTIADMARGAYLEQTDGRELAATASGQRYEYVAKRYDDIIRLKTAVLFAAAAKFGAIAAGAPEELRQKTFEFGICLGEAYQLADDLADVVKLPHRAEPEIGHILELAPMMIRFSEHRRRGLERLNSGDLNAFSAWILSEIPTVQEHVTYSIGQLQRKSVSFLSGIPENQFIVMLRDMPMEITKSAR